MKTGTLSSLAILVALAQFAAFVANPLAASIAVTVTGILAILLADYGRELRPLRVAARPVPFTVPDRTPAGLREAA
jgi:hypothetical protein